MKLLLVIATMLVWCLRTGGSASAQDAIEDLGLSNKNITSLSVNYGIVAVGTDRRGVFWQPESSPSSSEWMNAGLDTLHVQAVYAHKSGPIGWAISAGVYPDNGRGPFIYCSHMGGAFEPRSHGIDESITSGIDDIDGFPDMTICGETYAAGGRGLYLRNFADTTWKPVYTAGHDGHVATIKVRTEYPGVVLAGGGEGFSGFLLIKSTDFGQTWTHISPPTNVVSVDFSGSDADVIFAAGPSSIFGSRNGGTTWQVVWSGTGTHHIAEIAYDPRSGHVYAAGRAVAPDTSGFLILSRDDGENWTSVPLSTGPIVGLAVSGDGTYFATVNDGVFRFKPTVVGVENPTSRIPTLRQNYPNPVTDGTKIGFELTRPSSVTLTVYDLLARQIAVLTSGPMPAGVFVIAFDATELPSGGFVYVLEAGDVEKSRRMIVVK